MGKRMVTSKASMVYYRLVLVQSIRTVLSRVSCYRTGAPAHAGPTMRRPPRAATSTDPRPTTQERAYAARLGLGRAVSVLSRAGNERPAGGYCT